MAILKTKWIKILAIVFVLIAIGITGYKARSIYIKHQQEEMARQAKIRKELVHQAAQKLIKELTELSIVDLECTTEENQKITDAENNMEDVKKIVQSIVENRIKVSDSTMKVDEMLFENNKKIKESNKYLWDNALEEKYSDSQQSLVVQYQKAKQKKGFLEASQIVINNWDAKKAQSTIDAILKQPIPPA